LYGKLTGLSELVWRHELHVSAAKTMVEGIEKEREMVSARIREHDIVSAMEWLQASLR
jgi:hypothetical protein